VHDLPPLIVTARHFPELAADVPAQISVIAGRELTQLAPISLPEILNRHPGVTVRSFNGSPASGVVDLRGMGVTAGQRVLVLVNGRRLNRPDLGEINWLQVPAHLVDRIEILKGGQSVIYGDSAIGGVIKITTRRDDAEGGELSLMGGSYGLLSGSAAISLNGGRADGFAFASGYQEDGYRDRSAAEAAVAGGQVRYRFSERWEGITFLQAAKNETELPGGLGGYTSVGFPDNPRAAANPDEAARQTNWTLDQRFSGTLGNEVQAEVDLNLDRRDVEFELFNTGDTRIDSISIRPRALFEAAGIEWTAGLDLAVEALEFTGYASRSRQDATNKAELDRESAGIYVYGAKPLGSKWELRAGIRQQWFETEATHNAVNESDNYRGKSREDLTAATAGLNFRPTEYTRLWTRYDRVFRFPMTDEFASYQGFLLPVPFNDSLRAERGDSIEVGGEWTNQSWQVQAAVFYLELKDEIGFDNTVFLNVNKPGSKRLGAELNLTYRQESYTLSVGWMGLDAEITAGDHVGNEPDLTPKHTISTQAFWRPISRLEVGLVHRYTADQMEEGYLERAAAFGGENPDPLLPAYSIFDLHARFLFSQQLSAKLVLYNATDKDYATYKAYGGWYPAPGRTLRGQISYRF